MKEKRILKFEGIDDWNRPIFKDENNFRYGSTDKLFSWGTSPEEVSKEITVDDICIFGTKFGCEPDGRAMNPQRIKLVY